MVKLCIISALYSVQNDAITHQAIICEYELISSIQVVLEYWVLAAALLASYLVAAFLYYEYGNCFVLYRLQRHGRVLCSV